MIFTAPYRPHLHNQALVGVAWLGAVRLAVVIGAGRAGVVSPLQPLRFPLAIYCTHHDRTSASRNIGAPSGGIRGCAFQENYSPVLNKTTTT